MEDDKNKNENENEKETENKNPEEKQSQNEETKVEEAPAKSGGWGGWGFSPLSVLSDLQKAAEEISRNASVAAEKAAKSFVDVQNEDSEPLKEEEKAEGHCI
ncbi:hypothetical protein Patl1_36232 [Pistacia atlantica]|nr:hypothetical protein Patl1_36232 [Pistacia atlantica]